ncbi:MAG: 50S ribosomal protein L6 [Pseudomonadota bacterium]
MSRIANSPVSIPAGVEVSLSESDITVKGSKGSLTMDIHSAVEVKQDAGELSFASKISNSAMAGTTRSLVNNMIIGVNNGFEKKLQLIGVGYRAKVEGQVLNLTLGFSHPVNYQLPEGISAETPSQTEVVVKGIDKQLVGQVAAEIRAYRPPEPYKGKGVRYVDEYVRRKEAKKK